MVKINVNGISAEMSIDEFKEFVITQQKSTALVDEIPIHIINRERKHWSRKEKKLLTNMHDNGVSFSQMCKKLGRTANSVRIRLSRLKQPSLRSKSRRTHTSWTLAQTNEVLKRNRAGQTPSVIGKALGKTTSAIVNRLEKIKKYGIKTSYKSAGVR